MNLDGWISLWVDLIDDEIGWEVFICLLKLVSLQLGDYRRPYPVWAFIMDAILDSECSYAVDGLLPNMYHGMNNLI